MQGEKNESGSAWSNGEQGRKVKETGGDMWGGGGRGRVELLTLEAGYCLSIITQTDYSYD